MFFKHCPEFVRRPGQKNNDCVTMLIVNMQKLPRRRAAFVVERVSAVNDVPLALVVFRHLPATGRKTRA